MTEQEQRAWCDGLGKTPHQRMAVLTDLLRCACKDEMSSDDRVICRRQLERLHDEIQGWRHRGAA